MAAQRGLGERLMPARTAMDHTQSWQLLWQAFGVQPADPQLLAQLLARWAEPHRKYHSTEHLNACLRHFPRLQQVAERPHEVQMALWFHDAIYDIGSSDNEQRSADWARDALLAASVDPAAAQRVHALIMVTRHDCAPFSRDAEVLLDIDLAILGQPAHVFARYELQITDEFAAVPLAQRRVRRRDILQQFLDRPRIYHTTQFHGLYEAQARVNLQKSIERLTAA